MTAVAPLVHPTKECLYQMRVQLPGLFPQQAQIGRNSNTHHGNELSNRPVDAYAAPILDMYICKNQLLLLPIQCCVAIHGGEVKGITGNFSLLTVVQNACIPYSSSFLVWVSLPCVNIPLACAKGFRSGYSQAIREGFSTSLCHFPPKKIEANLKVCWGHCLETVDGLRISVINKVSLRISMYTSAFIFPSKMQISLGPFILIPAQT